MPPRARLLSSFLVVLAITIASVLALGKPADAVVCSINHYPYATFNGSQWMVSGYGEIACSEPVDIIDVYTYLVVSTGDPNSPIAQATQANHCYGYSLCAAIAGPLCCYSGVNWMHTKTWGDVWYQGLETNAGPTSFKCNQIDGGMRPSGIRIGAVLAMDVSDGGQPVRVTCTGGHPERQSSSSV
jgi:hypothetical protein